ncbi:hypothetical protein BJY04DRAFT_186002 [Aspergillus karnatakaensis]|uniref:uncharacterized protein n=1 Tax=Aspergillus karnatakaensis TaxID=1810916 RepID=UPI003CCDAE7D
MLPFKMELGCWRLRENRPSDWTGGFLLICGIEALRFRLLIQFSILHPLCLSTSNFLVLAVDDHNMIYIRVSVPWNKKPNCTEGNVIIAFWVEVEFRSCPTVSVVPARYEGRAGGDKSECRIG